MNWLDKLHATEIELLDELDRICKKNNLRYFLTGGTLIGAVRHKGFIPWDDDIDLGMPRDDYNKFIECCKTELGDKFELDCYATNKNYFLMFSKLRYKGTLCVENSFKDFDTNKGIWIDIFPYDNIDELNSKDHIKIDNYRHRIQKVLYGKLKRKSPEFRKQHRKEAIVLDIISPFLNNTRLIKSVYKKISKNKNNNSKYLSNMTGGYTLDKETHLRENIFPTVDLEFEGKKYPCPKEYDKVLTIIYGDYMKLPPEDQRVTHCPVMIKFPDGEVIEFEKEK